MSFFRILVVDDEEPMREVCREVLESAGYSVSVATDADEALGELGAGWDLVVSDFNMPGVDGEDFLRAAETIIPGIARRFVFMTGSIASAGIVEAMNCRLIRKPFKVKDLLNAVEAALGDPIAKRRAGDRVRVNGCRLRVSLAGKALAAVAEDISLNGMKIRYPGRPMAAGPGLRIDIEGFGISREAQVVWSSAPAESESFSGVLFEKPVPLSVISGLATGRPLS